MAASEPIVARLEVISGQYRDFAQDNQARVLCWLLQHDEVRMVEAFLAMQEDERAGEGTCVFITLKASFENPHAHGYVLRQELVAGYQEAKEAMTEAGVNADWTAPLANSQERDISFLVRTGSSFLQHHGIEGQLVLVLRPELVTYPDAYLTWIHHLAFEAPANVRVVVLGDATGPGFGALASADPQRVWIREPKLDMPAARQEISHAGGNLDKPGGQFRDLFVKLTSALGARDLAAAQSFGDTATGLATAQGWHHLVVPVQFALASAFSGEGQHQEALLRYQTAELAAVQGETEGPEEARASCPQLRLQARLGRGSTLVAAGAWRIAAQHFEETAPLAAEQANARATLDCYRLASFCHEQNGHPDEGFRVGLLGLQVAREMDRETLETSTFGYLGEALMRLTQRGSQRGLGPRIEYEIAAIAGTRDWRPKQDAPATVSPVAVQGVSN